LNGEEKTGVTLIKMDIGMDTGDMIKQKEIKISNDDNYGSLCKKLSQLGSEMILDFLFNAETNSNQFCFTKQDNSQVSFANIIKKEENQIDFNKNSKDIINLIRALNPKPGAFYNFKDKKIKVFKAKEVNYLNQKNIKENKKTGDFFVINNKELIVKTLDGFICIEQLQESGRKLLETKEYLLSNKNKFNEF
jgi:methionyl-tRNA formyltransferase